MQYAGGIVGDNVRCYSSFDRLDLLIPDMYPDANEQPGTGHCAEAGLSTSCQTGPYAESGLPTAGQTLMSTEPRYVVRATAIETAAKPTRKIPTKTRPK